VIGAILIVVIVMTGIIFLFSKINNLVSEASKELNIPKINAKAMEISSALDDIIRFKGQKEIIYDIKDSLLTIYSKGNFSALVIFTNQQADPIKIRGITSNDYYLEFCKINNNLLEGCYLQGLSLDDLKKTCSIYNTKDLAMDNNLFYCLTERAYTIININSVKYLVSFLPSPKLNLKGNSNFCNAYWVNLNGKKAVYFVCDYWIDKSFNCYFPRFIGQLAAYPHEGENKQVVFQFEGIKELKTNIYPFCKKSFLYYIKISSS
jgi:hypothetical protein